jgi:hypothetical protein
MGIESQSSVVQSATVNILSCLGYQHKLKIYGLTGGTVCVYKYNSYVQKTVLPCKFI